MQWLKSIRGSAHQYSLIVFTLLFFTICSMFIPEFFSGANLINISSQVALNALVATGMTMVILVGDVDLSAGAVAGLTSMLVSGIVVSMPGISAGGSVALIFGVSILIGTVFGSILGFSVTLLKVPPFIATLAMQNICRGLAYVYKGGSPVFGLPANFKWLGIGRIFNIPVMIFLMVLVLMAGHFFLKRTCTGRHFYAVGSNPEVAKLSGINVVKIKVLAHIICSCLASLAGACYASKLLSGQPIAGTGYELIAVAAVAIGGTSMKGGRGGVSHTFIGIIIIGILNNGMNLLKVSSYWQTVATGCIIMAAVVIDMALNKDK